MSHETIKINDVAYDKFNNLLVYDNIIDKLFESNDILIIIHINCIPLKYLIIYFILFWPG